MRVALAVQGLPPDLDGETPRSAVCLARALARAGHEVTVIAGSSRRADGQDAEVEVERLAVEGAASRPTLVRVRRPDSWLDHWHKSLAPRASETVRRELRERAVEVLHVHHWLRLSRDLVRGAALEGIPAVVSLNDHWASCPLLARVRPDTQAACEAAAGPHPCVGCAGRVAPRTPWVPQDEAWMAFARRQQDVCRELDLAHAITTPTAAHAEAIARFLGYPLGQRGVEVVPPAREPMPPPSRPLLEAPHGSPRLVLCAWGDLALHEGTDLLLAALARLGQPERFELRLLGRCSDPDFEHRLRNEACGLAVSFHGDYDPDRLGDHAATRAHAYVSATRAHEAYGRRLDEAFELGLPVIVPRNAVSTERCAAQTEGTARGALLHDGGDPEDLARVLARLHDEAGLWGRLREQVRDLAAALPGPDRIAARCVELYREARAAGPPQARPPEWFEARMADEVLRAWDDQLDRHTPSELGLSDGAEVGAEGGPG